MIIIIINNQYKATMYICVCNAVTERQVIHAVENGVSTVKQLKETLGVGSDCGKCVSCAKACITKTQIAIKSNHIAIQALTAA
jgi:bacterioferritin-associated ferredoxin